MYKEIINKISKGEDLVYYSEEEALNFLKKLVLEKTEEYSHLEKEVLEKNLKQAFKSGLTVLGLIHGAHFMGQNPESNAKRTPAQIKQDQAQIRQAGIDARNEGLQLYEKNKVKNRNKKIESFLDRISMIESSGGKNTNHKRMESGIHTGTAAVGSYGLMPNTIKELAGSIGDKKLSSYAKMNPKDIEKQIAQNPEHQKHFASHLANKLYDKFDGNDSKMAYSWNMGHNLTDKHFQTSHKDWQKHDYVNKYNKYNKQPSSPEKNQNKDLVTSNN